MRFSLCAPFPNAHHLALPFTTPDTHLPFGAVGASGLFFAQSVRRQLGMAEAEFAQALCISLVTLPDWEPGRCGRIRRLGLFC